MLLARFELFRFPIFISLEALLALVLLLDSAQSLLLPLHKKEDSPLVLARKKLVILLPLGIRLRLSFLLLHLLLIILCPNLDFDIRLRRHPLPHPFHRLPTMSVQRLMLARLAHGRFQRHVSRLGGARLHAHNHAALLRAKVDMEKTQTDIFLVCQGEDMQEHDDVDD